MRRKRSARDVGTSRAAWERTGAVRSAPSIPVFSPCVNKSIAVFARRRVLSIFHDACDLRSYGLADQAARIYRYLLRIRTGRPVRLPDPATWEGKAIPSLSS